MLATFGELWPDVTDSGLFSLGETADIGESCSNLFKVKTTYNGSSCTIDNISSFFMFFNLKILF